MNPLDLAVVTGADLPQFRSGQIVRRSGIYAADGREATLTRGDRFPPSHALWIAVRLSGSP